MAICAVCGDEYYGACKHCKKIYEAEVAAGKIHPLFLTTDGISGRDFHLSAWTQIRAAEQRAEKIYAIRHSMKVEDVTKCADGRRAIAEAANKAALEAIGVIKAWKSAPTAEQRSQDLTDGINRRSSY